MEKKDMALILLLVLLILTIVVAIFEFNKEGAKCLQDPPSYAMAHLEKEAGNKIYCTCNNNLILTSEGVSFLG